MPPRPRHYVNLDLSLVDEEEDSDPELTALLREKVVQVKREINWDEEEQRHLEKIRQKEALSCNFPDESDSDPGGAVVSASAPKRSKHLKSTRSLYMVKLKSSPTRRQPLRSRIECLSSGLAETESDRDCSETLGETEFEGERIATMSTHEGDTPTEASTATSPAPRDEECAYNTPQLVTNGDRGGIPNSSSSPEVTTRGRMAESDFQSGYESGNGIPNSSSSPEVTTRGRMAEIDIQSGYESGNEHKETNSESDSSSSSSYEHINLDRSVTPLIDSDAGMSSIDSNSEVSAITQNSFPGCDPNKTEKHGPLLRQVFLKKVIQLKIPKLPISTSICEECKRRRTSYSQAEFGYEQQRAVYSSVPVTDRVHWNSLRTDSNPLVSSLQTNLPEGFQSAQTVSHCSCGDCSCDRPCSQPNSYQYHYPGQHPDGNLFINRANINPHYPTATCSCCTQSVAMVQHLTPCLCHQPCGSSPCDFQPQAPSLPNYCYQCCSVVAPSSDVDHSLSRSSKRPLELDECDSTVTDGPQSKRLHQ